MRILRILALLFPPLAKVLRVLDEAADLKPAAANVVREARAHVARGTKLGNAVASFNTEWKQFQQAVDDLRT